MKDNIKITEAFLLMFVTFCIGVFGTYFIEYLIKYSLFVLIATLVLSIIMYFRELKISKKTKEQIGNLGIRTVCLNALKVLGIVTTGICLYNCTMNFEYSNIRLLIIALMLISIKMNIDTSKIMYKEVLEKYDKIEAKPEEKDFIKKFDKEMRIKYKKERDEMDDNIVETYNIMQVYRTIALLIVTALGVMFDIGIFSMLVIGMFIIAEDIVNYKVTFNTEKKKGKKEE